MIALHLLHPTRTIARTVGRLIRSRPRIGAKPGGSLEGVDRRTLSDIGIGRGAIVSLPHEIALDQLRRPPHL